VKCGEKVGLHAARGKIRTDFISKMNGHDGEIYSQSQHDGYTEQNAPVDLTLVHKYHNNA
jgi:hypothetical protein